MTFGFVLAEVVSYHDGSAYTFYFLRLDIYDTLRKMKTLRAYLGHGGLYGNVVRAINLGKEVGFDVDYDDAVFLPVDMRAYGSKIFCLA